jgi:SNF2 family DNA or RNA helicase
MTPFEAVREEFDFPFELRPYQIDEVNSLCVFNRTGYYWEPGAGKTAGSTFFALYHMLTSGVKQWVVPMPPILTLQWARWLGSIKDRRTGKPLSATVYAGTPKQRQKLDMTSQFILLSYGLLRNDFDRFTQYFHNRPMGIIIDEGHAIKNIQSVTHKTVRDLSEGRPLSILTGTPITKPIDAYAYIKLIAPGTYRNLRQFERIHVGETDEYGTVTKWENLELLAENMKIQTSRVLRRAVQSQIPPIVYSVIPYELSPAHLKLYNRIAEEKLVEFDDGREINAISTQALYSALQQTVINWGYFEDDDSKEPAALELIDEVFSQLEPGSKLVVVANFVRSNEYLTKKLAKYGAVAVYGGVNAAQKQLAIHRFITDPECLCIILQPQSAGYGVDGLQHVCCDMLILEAPTTAPPFFQVSARLDREGQVNPVNCRIGIANGTVQSRMFGKLLKNDETVNAVQGGFQDLRSAIHGN